MSSCTAVQSVHVLRHVTIQETTVHGLCIPASGYACSYRTCSWPYRVLSHYRYFKFINESDQQIVFARNARHHARGGAKPSGRRCLGVPSGRCAAISLGRGGHGLDTHPQGGASHKSKFANSRSILRWSAFRVKRDHMMHHVACLRCCQPGEWPELAESPVRSHLLEWLELGGRLLVVTSDDGHRPWRALMRQIPPPLRLRVVLSTADGAVRPVEIAWHAMH
eukprot:SAG11_NODE_4736_length_1786_cov_1.609959_1_plen_222_part_00